MRLRLSIWAALFFASISPALSEPQNIDLLCEDLQTYVETGAYQREFASAIEQARTEFDQLLSHEHFKHPAIVLDIDDTTLSNLPFYSQNHFRATHQELDIHVLKGKLPALAPTLSLFQHARKKGVDVFFVTGRRPEMRKATEKNLNAAGFRGFKKVFYMPRSIKPMGEADALRFKSETRKQLESEGYQILLALGDQRCDIDGGHTLSAIKLPNPFFHPVRIAR